eukprot:678003-Prorocentrum_minimum.AAC.4
MPQLAALSLAECDLLTDIGLASLARFQSLSRLHLAGCDAVSSIGIISLGPRLPHLRALLLTACAAVDDVALIALAHHASSLRCLDLRWANTPSANTPVGQHPSRLCVPSLDTPPPSAAKTSDGPTPQ